MNASIENIIGVVEGRHFAAIAFVYGNSRSDWLAAAWRDTPTGPWSIIYRFRYYRDGKAHDNADESNVYQAEGAADKNDDDMIDVLRRMGGALVQAGFNDRIDVIELRSSNAKNIIEIMRACPWFHAKRLS